MRSERDHDVSTLLLTSAFVMTSLFTADVIGEALTCHYRTEKTGNACCALGG